LFQDHYSQAALFYQSQTENEQAHIASALVFELSKVGLEHIRTRTLSRLRNVDEGLAARVAEGLAMELPEKAPAAAPVVAMEKSDALSIQKNAKQLLKGRKIGILFSDGSDAALISKIKSDAEKAGAQVMLIAPKIGGIPVSKGTLKAEGQLAGSPSVLLDAIALVLTQEAAEKLTKDGAAVDFVKDAFGHLKAIGHSDGAKSLLDKAGVEPDEGVVAFGEDFIAAAARRFYDREPKVRNLA
jgi:catalase